MEINPFEAPRTSDTGHTGDGAPTGELLLSEGVLRELAACAPWTRWLARLGGVSIVLSFVQAIVQPSASTVIGAVVGAVITGIFIAIYRRHTAAAERIAAGDPMAGPDAVDAQASYFKTTGVLAIIAIGFVILMLLMVAAAGPLLGPR
jgi:hypothetical protein